MVIEFKTDGTLVISPECSVELMALKYWIYEYKKHGSKMLEVMVETDVEVVPS